MSIRSVNPATGKLIKEFKEYSLSQVDEILEESEKGFFIWKSTSFDERSILISQVGELLLENKNKYAEIITKEMGKPISQSIAEIEKCALVCDYYATNAKEMLANKIVKSSADVSYLRYDPLGAILAVMPWNFPFWQLFRFAAPAIMAGNVVVLKHASNVPMAALEIEKIFEEAGFPMGVFSTLLVTAKTTEKVIRDERIAAVTLTGSEAAGKKVASIAAGALKKTVLELGGADPFIVLADADLEDAVEAAAESRILNAGQSCIAAKRFIVDKDVALDFSNMLRNKFKVMVVGDPMDEMTDIGPLARKDLRYELQAQVKKAVDEGATLMMGGKIPSGAGYYYPPTLLTEVDQYMTISQEETFGPVAPIFVVESVEEAIELANDCPYGLGGSIWTSDREKGEAIAAQIESGAVFINGLVKSEPSLPFGGIKNSGYGRELSKEGILEFVNVKTIWIGIM